MTERPESGSNNRDLITGWIAVGLTMTIALIVHTVFFMYKTSIMMGDISYHRGVALTMQGSTLQGEGPYAGLLSYFGGIYPLTLAGLSFFGGWRIDGVVSVLSWPFALAFPAAFMYLGWRLWPRRWVVIGLVTAVGTLATPWSVEHSDLWVESIVPSGQSFWPIYPRDIALAIMIVAIGSVAIAGRRRRILVLGVLIGLTVVTHPQLGLMAVLLVSVTYASYWGRPQIGSALRDLSLLVALALGVSAWWWIPRLLAAAESSRFLLASHPTRAPFVMTPMGFLIGYGLIGVFGVIGLVAGARTRTRPWRASVAMVISLLPIVVMTRIGGDLGVVTERRAWLVLSIPLIMLSGAMFESVAPRIRATMLAPVVAILLFVSSAGPTIATVKWIDSVWESTDPWGQDWESDAWDPIWTELNLIVRDEGQPTVVTYDAYALPIWSMSGARVHGSWLTGSVKLGFDLESLTGRSYVDRVADIRGAFLEGRPGLCRLADTAKASTFVLDVRNGSLGLWDSWVASAYRVDPGERSIESINRKVAEGVTYVDRNGFDALQFEVGAVYVTELQFDRSMRDLDIAFRLKSATADEVLEVRVGFERTTIVGGRRGYNRVRINALAGQTGAVTIVARSPLSLLRVTAFESVPRLDVSVDGVVVLDRNQLCPVDSES